MKKFKTYQKINNINFKKKEYLHIFHKKILKTEKIKTIYKIKLYKKQYVSTIFITQFKNICILSNRARGNLKKFRVSRIFFKNLASKGFFFGIKKSIW